MQDTLDIAGAGYEYGFILLYTGYFILVQWKNTTQVYNSGVTDGGRLTKVQSSPWQAKCKNWAYIEIHIRTNFHFQTFFLMLARCLISRQSTRCYDMRNIRHAHTEWSHECTRKTN